MHDNFGYRSGGKRGGVLFGTLVALTIVLGIMATAGARDFGGHIAANRIGASTTEAPADVRAVLRAAGM